jgi:hypothetical protein
MDGRWKVFRHVPAQHSASKEPLPVALAGNAPVPFADLGSVLQLASGITMFYAQER